MGTQSSSVWSLLLYHYPNTWHRPAISLLHRKCWQNSPLDSLSAGQGIDHPPPIPSSLTGQRHTGTSWFMKDIIPLLFCMDTAHTLHIWLKYNLIWITETHTHTYTYTHIQTFPYWVIILLRNRFWTNSHHHFITGSQYFIATSVYPDSQSWTLPLIKSVSFNIVCDAGDNDFYLTYCKQQFQQHSPDFTAKKPHEELMSFSLMAIPLVEMTRIEQPLWLT